MFGIVFRVAGAAGAAVGASYMGRSYYDLFKKNGGVAGDESSVGISSFPRLKRTIRIEYREGPDGKVVSALLDEETYTKEVAEQIKLYEAARMQLKDKADAALAASTQHAFHNMIERVPRFADWYFSYSTSYYFASRIVMSATTNSLSLTRTQTIPECISQDIESMIQQRYTNIVLRPELSDPLLQRSFSETVESLHRDFVVEVQRSESRLAHLVEQHAASSLSLPSRTLKLDWSSQAVKSNHLQTTFEKSPETGVGLVIAGGVVGKAAGGAVGGKVVSSTLATKLAAPFFSSGGLGGAAAGALAGPGGSIIGAGLGVTVDMLITKGSELIHRGDFERDVSEAIESTRVEWHGAKMKELSRAVDAWIDDAEESLRFEAKK